jgi:hypothetical protein
MLSAINCYPLLFFVCLWYIDVVLDVKPAKLFSLSLFLLDFRSLVTMRLVGVTRLNILKFD